MATGNSRFISSLMKTFAYDLALIMATKATQKTRRGTDREVVRGYFVHPVMASCSARR
jgi:hypothetical protein